MSSPNVRLYYTKLTVTVRFGVLLPSLYTTAVLGGRTSWVAWDKILN
jgi:hypothetical protein